MKQSDLMQGRNEGMRLALTIAERDGIDGLRLNDPPNLEYRSTIKLLRRWSLAENMASQTSITG